MTLEGSAEAMRWSDPLAGRPVTDGGWTSIGRTARFNYHNRYLSFSSLQRGGGRGESLPSGSINPEKVSGIVVWQRDGRRPSGRLRGERRKEGKEERRDELENREGGGGGEGGGKIYTLGPVHARICMPSARSMFEGAWGSSPLVHHPSNGRLH